MALSVWFHDDVRRILAATHETMRTAMAAAPPLDPEAAAAYQQGFGDAVRAMAIAFGVRPGSGASPSDWRALVSRVQPSWPGIEDDFT